MDVTCCVLQCLWSPLAFALGGTYIAQWELMQTGLQWSNVLTAPILDDHLPFVGVSFMLLLDLVLYLALAWYIEGVFPGRYGVAKPWYFPLQPSYWLGQGECNCHTPFLSWCAGLWGHVKGDQLSLIQEEEEQELLSECISVMGRVCHDYGRWEYHGRGCVMKVGVSWVWVR